MQAGAAGATMLSSTSNNMYVYAGDDPGIHTL
jgi:hypothetical protein